MGFFLSSSCDGLANVFSSLELSQLMPPGGVRPITCRSHCSSAALTVRLAQPETTVAAHTQSVSLAATRIEEFGELEVGKPKPRGTDGHQYHHAL